VKLATITIAPRFCGPPGSGNGGYVAGLLGGFASGEAVDVRLRVPLPLAVVLDVVAAADGGVELKRGGELLAAAAPCELELEVPAAPSFATAAAAAVGYPGTRRHVFPGCFVCGPARAAGDGLRVFTGLVHDGEHRTVAGAWRPDASLAGTRGRVRPEIMWAALDCPGYFAVMPEDRTMLVGRSICRIERSVEVGEPCVVLAWRVDGTGRRQRAGTAIFGADGRCVARALSTWIEPRAA
jgi:hypothetical protein